MWAVVLATIIVPRLQPQGAVAPHPVVSELSLNQPQSVMATVRQARVESAQVAQATAWSPEYDQGWNQFQARLEAAAEAQAEAARIAALSNHPPPPAYIAQIIHDAFVGMGDRALQWAFNVAYCESRYHPNSVNSSSGAAGLFQFLPSTWAFTPYHASSPFDPVANSNAAAWLYRRDGPSQWQCQG